VRGGRKRRLGGLWNAIVIGLMRTGLGNHPEYQGLILDWELFQNSAPAKG
jgi:hypothetical protein